MIRISLWVKSQNKIPDAISVNIMGPDNKINTATYENSGEWEHLTLEMASLGHKKTISLTLSVTNFSTSDVYFDDLQFELFLAKNNKDVPIAMSKRNDPNHFRIVATFPEDGFLIRKENFHRGWIAKIDNREVPILKVNDVFQAIQVPKGKTSIDFEFNSYYPFIFWAHVFLVLFGYVTFFYYLIQKKPLTQRP